MEEKIQELHDYVMDETRELSDDDYIGVLEQLSENFRELASARREELALEE